MVRLADRGYRPVAVSVTNDEGEWELKGMLSLFDPPRDDTAETIRIALTLGVEVKMITGDHVLIAKETARQLNMGTNIHSVHVLDDVEKNSSTRQLNDFVRKADGFAEVFPEHKFKIVDVLRDEGFVTGMTGDGVNDAPALKRADVGIAVEGSTEAAQAAADIVLTEPGLYTIIDAIIRSRKIFQRMRNYVMYRIACSFQLLIFLFISVLTIKPQNFFGFKTLPDGMPNPSSLGVESHAFVLPVTALVIITILNDGTIITISHDKVIPDKTASRWLLPEAVGIAAALGFCTTVASYLLLRAGTICANPNITATMATVVQDTGAARSVVCSWIGTKQTTSGDWYIDFGELLAAVYLEVSITDFLTVFAARTRSFAFTRRPGYALLCALVVANSASTILAAFWPFPNSGACTDNLAPIPGKVIGVVWIYSIVEFIVQDMFKVMVYFIRDKLNFEEKNERTEVEKRKVMTTALGTEKMKARETMDRVQLHREISVMRESSILASAPKDAEQDFSNLPPIRTEDLSKRNLV
jgi:H+-transporting ATPase